MPDLFIAGHMAGDIGLQGRGIRFMPGAGDNKSHRQFARLFIRHSDHRHICDGRMSLQQSLQFGRSHLKAFQAAVFEPTAVAVLVSRLELLQQYWLRPG